MTLIRRSSDEQQRQKSVAVEAGADCSSRPVCSHPVSSLQRRRTAIVIAFSLVLVGILSLNTNLSGVDRYLRISQTMSIYNPSIVHTPTLKIRTVTNSDNEKDTSSLSIVVESADETPVETIIKTMNTENNDRNQVEQESSKSKPPGIVWLASFPNSGTSYTLESVRRISNLTIATNYGKEDRDHSLVRSRPIHPAYTNGPFFTSDRERSVPNNFVLTKTHCGGKCVECPPHVYMETQRSFLQQCLSGHPLLDSNDGKTMNIGESVQYERSIVKKAIHLIRDPFNNVVSRFHHAHKHKRDDESFKARYPRNIVGFKAWCANLDTKHGQRETRVWQKSVVAVSRNVPCRSEFYRYVQWHNLAIASFEILGIPTLSVSYEDYDKDTFSTMSSILSFLELPHLNITNEYHPGSYATHFTMEERELAMNMMKTQSSAALWERLDLYKTAWSIDID